MGCELRSERRDRTVSYVKGPLCVGGDEMFSLPAFYWQESFWEQIQSFLGQHETARKRSDLRPFRILSVSWLG